ncbi:TPA: hypothetical protein ACQ8O5_005156, partial [Escherichia coli]
RKRAYCLKIQPATESFARNLIYSTKPLYTTNPDAAGYGIYLVFWFGASRPKAIPRPAKNTPPPVSARTMADILNEAVPIGKRDRLSAVVIDVSGEANSTVEMHKTSM